MKKTLMLMLILPLVAACGGGQDSATKAQKRAELNAQVFPDPADRQGMFLVFPLESGGFYRIAMTTWFTDEVSRGEVANRILGFCKRQDPRFTRLGVRRDNGPGTRTLHTGETKPTYSVTYECLS
ncbi:MAG: hypothetical protein AAFY31_03660 [Pseudomonadota bacterium]